MKYNRLISIIKESIVRNLNEMYDSDVDDWNTTNNSDTDCTGCLMLGDYQKKPNFETNIPVKDNFTMPKEINVEHQNIGREGVTYYTNLGIFNAFGFKDNTILMHFQNTFEYKKNSYKDEYERYVRKYRKLEGAYSDNLLDCQKEQIKKKQESVINEINRIKEEIQSLREKYPNTSIEEVIDIFKRNGYDAEGPIGENGKYFRVKL